MSKVYCPFCGNYNPSARQTNTGVSSHLFYDVDCGSCNSVSVVCLPKRNV